MARDSLYEALEWNISPQVYFESVAGAQSDYLLLHATDSNVDGYGKIMEVLRKQGLIRKEFGYMTYTVSIVRPLQQVGWVLNCSSFDKSRIFDLNGKKVTALWDNSPVTAQPVDLPAGTFSIAVLSAGTAAKGIFPHIKVVVDDKIVGDYFTAATYKEVFFSFTKAEGNVKLQLLMDNGLSDAKSNEDRNAFIQHAIIEHKGSR